MNIPSYHGNINTQYRMIMMCAERLDGKYRSDGKCDGVLLFCFFCVLLLNSVVKNLHRGRKKRGWGWGKLHESM